jgi:purine-binding chemotaxis protein CheW
MTSPYVVFMLGDQRCALSLHSVDRVVHMVKITLLPRAPAIVLGVVNMQGSVIPVVDVRRRFGLPERQISLNDHLVVTHTTRRPFALVVDAVVDVVECQEQNLAMTKSILPTVEYLEGVMKLKSGLVLIHDLEAFLSLEEEDSLDRAMDASRGA